METVEFKRVRLVESRSSRPRHTASFLGSDERGRPNLLVARNHTINTHARIRSSSIMVLAGAHRELAVVRISESEMRHDLTLPGGGLVPEARLAEDESHPPQQAGRIKDARGRVVSQLDPVMMHLLHRHDTIPRDVLEELAKRIGIKITRATRLAFWGGWACLIVCAVALTILLTGLVEGAIGFRRFVQGTIPFMGSWIGPFTFWATTRKARHERIGQVVVVQREMEFGVACVSKRSPCSAP